MGIGHELRGDDAAGIMAAQALKPIFAQCQDVLVVDGGHAPENQTSALRRFTPDLVLLIDAAQMGERSGTIRWLTGQAMNGLSASTHTIPLDVLTQYLNAELGCEVALIGIQTAQLDIGSALSPAVRRSVNELVQSVSAILKRANHR